MDRKDCTHDRLWFGSGDYYLFCDCGAAWVMKAPGQDVAAPELANQYRGATISGGERINGSKR